MNSIQYRGFQIRRQEVTTYQVHEKLRPQGSRVPDTYTMFVAKQLYRILMSEVLLKEVQDAGPPRLNYEA
jgi:hypothetical protein